MERLTDWQKSRLIDIAVEQAYNAVLITDADFDGGPFIVHCNPAFCRMTGYERAELLGQSPRMLQGPDTCPKLIASLRTALADATYWEGSTTNYRKDGTPYVVQWSISPVFDDEGHVTHYVSVQRDVTARVRAEAERDLLSQALNQAHDPILVTDRQARIVFVNAAFERLTGYSTAELMGKNPSILKSGEQGAEFYRQMWETLLAHRPFQARFVNRRKDGSLYHAEQSIAPVLDAQGVLTHFISSSWQVDELVKRERELHAMASRDKLTGLLNRHAGDEALQSAHRQHLTCEQPLSVIICDIDHFKRVNDRFGHLAGDRVIRQVARTITQQLRDTDPAIRWGGEEFLVVAQMPMQSAQALAERLRQAVEWLEDEEVGTVTLSLGVAEMIAGETPKQLLERADGALYRAKSSGRNCVVSATGQ